MWPKKSPEQTDGAEADLCIASDLCHADPRDCGLNVPPPVGRTQRFMETFTFSALLALLSFFKIHRCCTEVAITLNRCVTYWSLLAIVRLLPLSDSSGVAQFGS